MNITSILSRPALSAMGQFDLYNAWKANINQQIPGFADATSSAPAAFNPTPDVNFEIDIYPYHDTNIGCRIKGKVKYNGTVLGAEFDILDRFNEANDGKYYYANSQSFFSKATLDWGIVVYPVYISSSNKGGFYYASSSTLNFTIVQVAESASSSSGYKGGLWDAETGAFLSISKVCASPDVSKLSLDDGSRAFIVSPRTTPDMYSKNTFAPLSIPSEQVSYLSEGVYNDGKAAYVQVKGGGSAFIWMFDTSPIQ